MKKIVFRIFQRIRMDLHSQEKIGSKFHKILYDLRGDEPDLLIF